ncbi:hypothetical protein GCM10009609_19180 [Pseudonocardia aurantiaca]
MDGAIGAVSLATSLAGLDRARLIELPEHRPDVLVEPVPRSVAELAERLNGVGSLSRALPEMNRGAGLSSSWAPIRWRATRRLFSQSLPGSMPTPSRAES